VSVAQELLGLLTRDLLDGPTAARDHPPANDQHAREDEGANHRLLIRPPPLVSLGVVQLLAEPGDHTRAENHDDAETSIRRSA